MQGAMQFLSEDFDFTVSLSCVNEFKRKFRISQRKITILIKPTEKKSIEQLKENAQQCQNEYFIDTII